MDDGYRDGLSVSPGRVGTEVDGYLEGAELGWLLGLLVDGRLVGHDEGCLDGTIVGAEEG